MPISLSEARQAEDVVTTLPPTDAAHSPPHDPKISTESLFRPQGNCTAEPPRCRACAASYRSGDHLLVYSQARGSAP